MRCVPRYVAAAAPISRWQFLATSRRRYVESLTYGDVVHRNVLLELEGDEAFQLRHLLHLARPPRLEDSVVLAVLRDRHGTTCGASERGAQRLTNGTGVHTHVCSMGGNPSDPLVLTTKTLRCDGYAREVARRRTWGAKVDGKKGGKTRFRWEGILRGLTLVLATNTKKVLHALPIQRSDLPWLARRCSQCRSTRTPCCCACPSWMRWR